MIRSIVLLFAFLFLSHDLYSISRLQFRNIGFKEGLNNMNISAITQDKLGYIWVATMGGVSRYNGYEFKHYYFDSSNPESLGSNHVSSIFCASDGLIYIGTAIGLDCYDNRIDKMLKPFPDLRLRVMKIVEYKGFIYLGTVAGLYRFSMETKQLEELGGNLAEKPMINNLLFDKNGNLWCALDNGKGFAVYDLGTDRFDICQNETQLPVMDYNTIRTFFQVTENVMLLGTKGGISFFDLKSRKFIEHSDFAILKSSLAGYDVLFMLEKEPSIYWIGTLQSGFFIYDKARNTVTRLLKEDEFSEIHSNYYMNYFIDKTGNIWLGTFNAGMDVWFNQARNFNFDVSLNNLTRNKFITSIASDQDNNLIIATNENGFWTYDPDSHKHQLFTTSNSELKHNILRTVFVDSENKYWVGVYFGLQIFNPENKSFKTIPIPEPNFGAVSFLQFGNRIFVGTDGQGLLVFDLDGILLKQFKAQGNNVPMMIQLNESELFFGCYESGLFAMNFDTYAVRKIDLADVKKYPGLLFAMTAYMDKQGIIWVGTYNYGMFAFDLKNSKVRNITIKDGLPSTDAIGFEEDGNSNLWVSTSYGLVKLNKNDFSIKTYSTNEGVNNYQFHGSAVHKDKRGIIYFGGNSGLTYFNPAEILVEPSNAPHVVLENLYVQNLVVNPSEKNSTLIKSLPFTKQIDLTHKDQIFSVDFVSFDYLSPEKVRYFYMLEGFDKDWYSVGTQRRVSYSNLPRGNYVFRVKSVNHAGIKSENEAELMIEVKPAPWFSYTAWTIYVAIMAAIAYVVFSLRIKAFVYKKNLEIEHSEHLREHEINVMKQKFFTNISHELRTPLTLIYGLVTQLSGQEKLSPKVREFAQSLDVNVTRLLKLINQLLAYKKLEGETLSLWLDKGNLNESIQRILELFNFYAKEKEIRIDFLEDNSFEFWFDYDKLEKILSNLLSNSVKHSQKGSRIEVAVRKITLRDAETLYNQKFDVRVSDYVEISVTDNGPGIDEKDWSTIFDRYKQVDIDGKQRPDYSGTGIGLNFTRSLVELHKGKIRMESKLGQGTTFAFILPLDSSVFELKDFSKASSSIISESKDVLYQSTEMEMPGEVVIRADFEKTVLVVEDDPQLNSFLVDVLKNYYKTINAHDGEKGLKMVRQELPDLVISDIMMPKKDGYELTKAIKESGDLCHIPVILLTARTETASQIEGMQSGADLYVAKPFNIDFLLAAIDAQLKNRKRIQDIFMNGQMPRLDSSEINQLDVQFLTKMNVFLEEQMANPDMDIQLLSQNMNLSRSAFYRKFMNLTKLSPIAYIKKYRINKSVEFMNSGKYTLTEIGEMTGFGSPSYFSTAFKQEKGISPREFVNKMKDNIPPKL